MPQKRTSGRFTVQYMPVPVPGPVGLTPRLSVWKAGERYRNDTDNTDIAPRYIDYVTDVDVALLGETEYHVYRCVKQHQADSTTRKPGNTEFWTEISSGYGPFIAPLLLSRKIIADFIDVASLTANSAFIDSLTVKKLDCVPSSGRDKLVIKDNELSIIDGDGDYKVRIFGGSIKGSCDGGKHEYYLSTTTTFDDDTTVLNIPGGMRYAYKNIKPEEIDLGYLPKGSTIVVPVGFELMCGFTVNCNGYDAPSGKYMLVSDNGYKRICQTNISVNLAIIDKASGEEVYSLTATDEYGQDNVPISSYNALLERTAREQVVRERVVTQVNDGSVYKLLVTGTIGVIIDSDTVPYDDTLTLNQISVVTSVATNMIYTQEPNILVIGSDGMFIRYNGDNGYGFIGPSGMFFQGGGKRLGVDGRGPYLQTDTFKYDLYPNNSDNLVHCGIRT